MLTQRLFGDERLQLGDDGVVPAEREVGVDALLEGREAEVVEPPGPDLRERLAAKLRKRRTAPEGQRFAQQR